MCNTHVLQHFGSNNSSKAKYRIIIILGDNIIVLKVYENKSSDAWR